MSELPAWLCRRNTESWEGVLRFYDHLLSQRGWEWVAPVARVARRLADSEARQAFRAGQSMWRLIVSTAEHYGLSDEDAFLMCEPLEDGRIRLEYRSPTGESSVAGPFQGEGVIAEVEERLNALASVRRPVSEVEPA